jgi:hypothetical protein
VATSDDREELPIILSAEEVADLYEAELAPRIAAMDVLAQAALHARLADARAEFEELHGRAPESEEMDVLVASIFAGQGLAPDPDQFRKRIARYAVGKAVRTLAEQGYVEIAGPSEVRARPKLFEADGRDLPSWIRPAFVNHLRSYFLEQGR